jgi:dienelactone hydrolase
MKLSPALFLPTLVFLSTTGCNNPDPNFLLSSGPGTTSTGAGNNGGGGTGGGGMGGSGGSAGSASTSSGSSGGSGGSGGSTATSSGGAGGSTSTTSSGGGGAGGSMMIASDPTKDGPYQTATVDDNISSGNHQVPIHCVYPVNGPEAGPYPVIVIGHGLQTPASQYYKYAERLATFGYVALTAEFPAKDFKSDDPANAADLIAGLDWAKSKLPNQANTDLAGATGHSLGGKLALLAATMDPRFKASITLDPVDGGNAFGGGCQPPGCADVSAMMPMLNIPTGFLGETTDAMGGLQACAPAAENYTTFYALTNAPSLSVTVNGANNNSFLDDASICGFPCNLCNAAALDNATVNGMARAYVVAFYERYLRKNLAYDTYLTGQKAQDLYVATGIATIESK